MDIELQFALESFQRWFNGERLTSDEITVIAMSILLCVMLIVTIALLVYLSRVTLFWTRIGWAFEDLWHWFKRYTTPIPGTCLCDEELTDEDVREIMDIIHKGNPRSTKSRRPRTVGSTLSWRIKSNNTIKHQEQ